MESVLGIILLGNLIMNYALSDDVKVLKCYECNKEYSTDPKCDIIARDQQNYFVACNSSAVKCLLIVNYGQSYELKQSQPSGLYNNNLAFREPSKEYIDDDDLVTTRQCATQDTVDWCLSLSHPTIDCNVCDIDGCNGFDMNPQINNE